MPHNSTSISRSLATAFQIPISRSLTVSAKLNALHNASNAARSFSSSGALLKRKGQAVKPDPKITMLRYSLEHPVRLIPRPLRFSRTRYLRHWTIQRAWSLYRAKQREAHLLELQKQYQAMRIANEDLRTNCGPLGEKLFRQASQKKGVHGGRSDMGILPEGVGERKRVERGREGGVPIEYARGLVDTLGKSGWDYEWKRG